MTRAWTIALVLLLAAGTAGAADDDYSGIFAFGSSFTTTFNSPIGLTCQFNSTDGSGWLEYLAVDLGLPSSALPWRFGGGNYAFGGGCAVGERARDLSQQMIRFHNDHPTSADPQALYVMYIGFNDILRALVDGTGCGFDAENLDLVDPATGELDLAVANPLVDEVVANILGAMEQIRLKGGHYFLVAVEWDLSTLPLIDPWRPGLIQGGHDVSVLLNERLEAVLAVFPASVGRFDMFALSNEVEDDPAAFGFTEANPICSFPRPPYVCSGITQLFRYCDGHRYFDFIHPTSQYHELIASRVKAVAQKDYDNCVETFNPDQRDTDGDGYGNACDPDFNDDGIVGASDFIVLSAGFGKALGDPGFDPDLDLDGDGLVGTSDLNRLVSLYGQPPGPSDLSCAGTAPCPAP